MMLTEREAWHAAGWAFFSGLGVGADIMLLIWKTGVFGA